LAPTPPPWLFRLTEAHLSHIHLILLGFPVGLFHFNIGDLNLSAQGGYLGFQDSAPVLALALLPLQVMFSADLVNVVFFFLGYPGGAGKNPGWPSIHVNKLHSTVSQKELPHLAVVRHTTGFPNIQ
jgi:hypothetical protein